MKADPNLKVLEQEGLNVSYLAYNTTQPPFDKVEVRRALNKAIQQEGDRRPPSSRAWPTPAVKTRFRRPCGPTTKTPRDDSYDLEAAKKMLADAGVKDLFHEDLGHAGFASVHAERPSRR